MEVRKFTIVLKRSSSHMCDTSGGLKHIFPVCDEHNFPFVTVEIIFTYIHFCIVDFPGRALQKTSLKVRLFYLKTPRGHKNKYKIDHIQIQKLFFFCKTLQ